MAEARQAPERPPLTDRTNRSTIAQQWASLPVAPPDAENYSVEEVKQFIDLKNAATVSSSDITLEDYVKIEKVYLDSRKHWPAELQQASCRAGNANRDELTRRQMMDGLINLINTKFAEAQANLDATCQTMEALINAKFAEAQANTLNATRQTMETLISAKFAEAQANADAKFDRARAHTDAKFEELRGHLKKVNDNVLVLDRKLTNNFDTLHTAVSHITAVDSSAGRLSNISALSSDLPLLTSPATKKKRQTDE